MAEKTAINRSAYCYSVNMLRWILEMKLITKEEFEKIRQISAEHYNTELYCV